MSFKSGFVAITGRPNVGKSTFLNAILKQKIAIISPKPQTTRNTIHGVYNDSDCQIVFLDTPGIHKARTKLGEVMNRSAIGATRDVEAILFIVSAEDDIGSGDQYVLELIKKTSSPVILVINKVDLVAKEVVYHKINQWRTLADFHEIVPISALKNKNVDILLKCIKKLLPEGPKYYPDGMISDHPESFIITEFIREKILLNTHEEVPHSIAVVVEKIQSLKKDVIEVNVAIVVERDSQKGIIIGAQGSMLKKIGTQARRDIEHLLGSKIMLQTFVRVESNGRNNPRYLREFGYKDE